MSGKPSVFAGLLHIEDGLCRCCDAAKLIIVSFSKIQAGEAALLERVRLLERIAEAAHSVYFPLVAAVPASPEVEREVNRKNAQDRTLLGSRLQELIAYDAAKRGREEGE